MAIAPRKLSARMPPALQTAAPCLGNFSAPFFITRRLDSELFRFARDSPVLSVHPCPIGGYSLFFFASSIAPSRIRAAPAHAPQRSINPQAR
jgi:hypothetical protein